MGPSGSGKSTLLNVLGALDRPTSGTGAASTGRTWRKIHDMDGFRAKTVGFMFQLHNLLPTLTARENVEVPMTGYLGPRARRQRAEELLELVGLQDRLNHLPRPALWRAAPAGGRWPALWRTNRPLILADEPTGSLDTTAGQDLMNLLKELNRSQGVTFVIVTHDPAWPARPARILVMADGKIVREDLIGSPLEEDLKMWRHSGLGQRICSNDVQELAALGISAHQVGDVKALLKLANGEEK